MKILTTILALSLLFVACDDGTTTVPVRDETCDDGAPLTCTESEPVCDTGYIPAIISGCWYCVTDDTCEWEQTEADCTVDADCGNDEYCNPCATSSCPWCNDCVALCSPHGCDTGILATCFEQRPQCEDPSQTAVVIGDCWKCVDRLTCSDGRDTSCDDQTTPLCDMLEPTCKEYEILAWQDDCYRCVLPWTCDPVECHYDNACPDEELCDPCGTECPGCEETCVPGCGENPCATGATLTCADEKPYCGENLIAIVQESTGCWQCVLPDTCETERDEHCDDGSFPVCSQSPPDCPSDTIMAYMWSCYECVDPVTCQPVN